MIKQQCNAALQDNPIFLSFVETLPQTFDSLGEIVHDARNQLRKVEVADWGIPNLQEVMIKKYHGLFFFQRIWYSFFRAPKCRRAYNNTVELRHRGLPAVEEVACVEVWSHGLFKYGFFISKVGEGERMDSLIVKLKIQGENDEIQKITHKAALLVAHVHQRGVLYKDMNPGNLLCTHSSTNNDWQISLIDTNRARISASDSPLPLASCIPEIILMNPILGIEDAFINDYLHIRSLYSAQLCKDIRHIQYRKHERKRPLKERLGRFKAWYFKWLKR
ncbi:MAG: hypothetical protein IJ142_10515 [Bacteroidaceae bacterium]|nr:hypothetical protein [Bacteroidaceae bacterium]MBQ9192009.1 hypothetical protein [Bacteroidaceae bacterium]